MNEGFKDKLEVWDWICHFIDLMYSLLKFILSVIIFLKSHSLYILICIKTVKAHNLKKKVIVQKDIWYKEYLCHICFTPKGNHFKPFDVYFF